MNDEIRAQVNQALAERKMSRSELARAIGRQPQAITRALNGNPDGGGKIPEVWAAILDALDLELTTRQK